MSKTRERFRTWRSLPAIAAFCVSMASRAHGAAIGMASSASLPSSTYPPLLPVNNSKPLSGSDFIGGPVTGQSLTPKYTFSPDAALLHADSGNTGSSDFPGPLGRSLTTSSAQTLGIFRWARDGRVTASYVDATSGTDNPRYGLSAVDPRTFQVLSTWFPPIANETLGITYLEYLLDSDDIVTSSAEGHIYVVHREPSGSGPAFATKRVIDVSKQLQPAEVQLSLLNAIADSSGNFWFTSGSLHLGTGEKQNTTVVGYVTPAGSVVTKVIPESIVENGIASHNDTVFMVTGPAGATDTANATSHMWFLKAAPGGVEVLWQAPYEAGFVQKPGTFGRGAGTTPALLSDEFVAITDNADEQINLNVFHQSPRLIGCEEQFLCKVPLFSPGASGNSIVVTVHKDGDSYGAVILNEYNAPAIARASDANFTLNGAWNNMTGMAKGVTRVNINSTDHSCTLAWTINEAWKTVPVLSTKTGLLYGYTQDLELAAKGEYVWYFVATGEEARSSLNTPSPTRSLPPRSKHQLQLTVPSGTVTWQIQRSESTLDLAFATEWTAQKILRCRPDEEPTRIQTTSRSLLLSLPQRLRDRSQRRGERGMKRTGSLSGTTWCNNYHESTSILRRETRTTPLPTDLSDITSHALHQSSTYRRR